MKSDLKQQVKQILKDLPKTRDSDTTLMIEVWLRYYPNLMKRGASGDVGIHLKDLYTLPSGDDVKRHRATIQNTEGKYPPTTWEVAKQRKFLEERWRELLKRPDTL